MCGFAGRRPHLSYSTDQVCHCSSEAIRQHKQKVELCSNKTSFWGCGLLTPGLKENNVLQEGEFR